MKIIIALVMALLTQAQLTVEGLPGDGHVFDLSEQSGPGTFNINSEVGVGEEIQIIVEDNRSLPYEWVMVKRNGLIADIGDRVGSFTIEGSKYTPNKKEDGTTGSGGKTTFYISVHRPGKQHLVLYNTKITDFYNLSTFVTTGEGFYDGYAKEINLNVARHQH